MLWSEGFVSMLYGNQYLTVLALTPLPARALRQRPRCNEGHSLISYPACQQKGQDNRRGSDRRHDARDKAFQSNEKVQTAKI